MSSAVITSNGKSFRFEHLDLRTASIIASLEGICVICVPGKILSKNTRHDCGGLSNPPHKPSTPSTHIHLTYFRSHYSSLLQIALSVWRVGGFLRYLAVKNIFPQKGVAVFSFLNPG